MSIAIRQAVDILKQKMGLAEFVDPLSDAIRELMLVRMPTVIDDVMDSMDAGMSDMAMEGFKTDMMKIGTDAAQMVLEAE